VNGFSRDEETRLLELLGQELELFKQIREMTNKQVELLAQDDVESFDESLDLRQEIIEEINGLHQESEILMQSYVSFSGTQSKEKTASIETAVDNIRAVIEECIGMNNKNEAEAAEKAEDYIMRIGKLSLTRKSIGKYAQSVPNNPEFFDKKT